MPQGVPRFDAERMEWIPMFNACNQFRGCTVVSIIALSALCATAAAQSSVSAARGPLARLVRTPDDGTGFPPYALADQAGTIQRYVEPVPGIDLEPYVNQSVTVRHDTGETLLASQLDLPQQALLPMVGADPSSNSRRSSGRNAALADASRADRFVQQAEFVDNNDNTVELMDEGGMTSAEIDQGQGNIVVPEGAIYPDGSPAYPMSPGTPMNAGPMYYGQGGPVMIEPYPSDYGPYPQFGGVGPGIGPNMGFVQPFGQPTGQAQQNRSHLYGHVEVNFLRAHVSEGVFGKLSEKYEFSPRFVIGFTDVGPLSGRVRYWIYGRGTNGLSDDNHVHIDFDVWDVEATHLFAGKRSQLMVAGGIRLAGIEIEDNEGDAAGTDLIGLTLAGDGWTPLLNSKHGSFGWTYGGRLSILAGDWAGSDDSELLDSRIRDDNVVVHELYAGLGFTRCCRNIDLNARLVFEMQNWHSDVLSEASGGDSLGFVGPGVHIGAEF